MKNKGRKKIINSTQMPEIILGLDCSSSTVGWGVVGIEEKEIKLLAYGHFKPLKSNNDILCRLDNLCDCIIELCEEFDPMEVVVEDIIQYMKGLSKSSTIITLACFNRAASLAAYRECHVDVSFYPVSTIRKLIKDHNCLKESIKKEDMPAVVKEYLSNEFTYHLNKKGEVSKEASDEADGIAVAWARAIEVVK